jgi:hypothetical protein
MDKSENEVITIHKNQRNKTTQTTLRGGLTNKDKWVRQPSTQTKTRCWTMGLQPPPRRKFNSINLLRLGHFFVTKNPQISPFPNNLVARQPNQVETMTDNLSKQMRTTKL